MAKPRVSLCSYSVQGGKVLWAIGFWHDRPVIASRWNGSDKAPIGTGLGFMDGHVQHLCVVDDTSRRRAEFQLR